MTVFPFFRCLRPVIAVLILLCAFGPAIAETDCSGFKKERTLKMRQLAQYVDGLKKVLEQGDWSVGVIMNHKIRELMEEVRGLEELAKDCPKEEEQAPSKGMESVKSDQGEYATLSCEELRTALLQFVQKTSDLKRRASSRFSALTPNERSELEEAERAFKALKAAIGSRCPKDEPMLKRFQRR